MQICLHGLVQKCQHVIPQHNEKDSNEKGRNEKATTPVSRFARMAGVLDFHYPTSRINAFSEVLDPLNPRTFFSPSKMKLATNKAIRTGTYGKLLKLLWNLAGSRLPDSV
jgi:hypothetical protein